MRRLLAAGLALAALSVVPAEAAPSPAGHRPGPDLLYAAPVEAPQLQNRPGSGWRAEPLLVSGAAAHVDGEYLYQGYLYDDHGAAGTPDLTHDPVLQGFTVTPKYGTLTYPTDPVFAHNAADLVELRVRPTVDSTAFRVTLNTLQDPRRTAFTIAIGSSAAPVTWPAAAGVRSPAQLFLTVHGSTAELADAATGRRLATPTVTVDPARRQYDVRVPHRAWDPKDARVSLAAGVGLWDVAGDHYLAPEPQASATTPGGAARSGAALFDMAFRFAEPEPDWKRMGLATNTADITVVGLVDQHCFWRECAQATALAAGDVSPLRGVVDFGRLLRKDTDLSQVPRTGSIDRIHASRFSHGQGLSEADSCGRLPLRCRGLFAGNLQPYNVYVPARPVPRRGFGLTLQLHASGANYNQHMGSNLQRQLGERGQGSITLTPLGRDPNGDYTEASEADVFEAWADAARHYRLDPTRTVLNGYSMGGGGTYKLAERWPDLFARAFGAAALPYDNGYQGQWLRNLRHVPLLTWISLGDEGSGPQHQSTVLASLKAQGLRFDMTQFPQGDHVTLATNDEWGPAAAWLGDARVVRDPSRVTYAVSPQNDFPRSGLVADHAYWLSGLTLRSDNDDSLASDGPTDFLLPAQARQGSFALVDARSEGFGQGEPAVSSHVPAPGVLNGGNHGPMPYATTTQTWSPAPAAPAADRLVLSATNLASVTVDVRAARLTCNARLDVTTDGPLKVRLAGCSRTVSFRAGHHVTTAS